MGVQKMFNFLRGIPFCRSKSTIKVVSFLENLSLVMFLLIIFPCAFINLGYVCMYVCMYVCVCVYVCMYVGVYVCMYVCK